MRPYIALIHKDPDSEFGISFPDFPGCISAAGSADEARVMAVEALALHIAGMIEDDLEIPQPSSLDEVLSNPDNRDGLAVLVEAPQLYERLCELLRVVQSGRGFDSEGALFTVERELNRLLIEQGVLRREDKTSTSTRTSRYLQSLLN